VIAPVVQQEVKCWGLSDVVVGMIEDVVVVVLQPVRWVAATSMSQIRPSYAPCRPGSSGYPGSRQAGSHHMPNTCCRVAR
jgi:hypothetical protein